MVFSLSFQKKYLIFPESKQDSTIESTFKSSLEDMRISETCANAQKQQKRWNKMQRSI